MYINLCLPLQMAQQWLKKCIKVLHKRDKWFLFALKHFMNICDLYTPKVRNVCGCMWMYVGVDTGLGEVGMGI